MRKALSISSAVVPVVLTTHDAEEAGMMRALAQIEALDAVSEPPCMIRIETFSTGAA